MKQLWRVLEENGPTASMNAMLEQSHEDVELRPYAAEGRAFRGAAEIREFFRKREAAGGSFHASVWGYAESGDCVYVSGSIRVHRPDGSIADAQVKWIYEFRDGLVACASVGPINDPDDGSPNGSPPS